MSAPDTPNPDDAPRDANEGADPPPQALELRAKPPRIGQIRRRMVIGAAFVGLMFLAGLVVFALRPPWFAGLSPTELFSTDRNPTPEGLNRLPSTYDGLSNPKQARAPATANATAPAKDAFPADPVADRAEAERTRLARLELQARESGLFFRMQLKAAPNKDAPRAGGETRAIAQTAGSLAADVAPFSALSLPSRAEATDVPSVSDAADQTRKLAFLTSAPERDTHNPHRLQTPASPYQLLAGTIIAASLVSGLNSDLPGAVIAQVTEHVYDTATGRFLLVPQGTRLIGKYDSVVAFGQQRALVVWQRLILPDGSSVVIDNLPATDTGGYTGLTDEIDLHTWTLLKGIALATVLGVGNSLAFGAGSSASDSDLIKALRESTGQTTNRAGQRLVERNLTVQPTLTVRPGWPLRIIVHKDLQLRPYRMPGLPIR